jgi:hypothetical protein
MVDQSKCATELGGWSVGLPGTCVSSEYGYKAGRGGIKSVIMQVCEHIYLDSYENVALFNVLFIKSHMSGG